jgi:hypothetical protein
MAQVGATMAGESFSSDVNFSRAHCVYNAYTDLFSRSFNEKYNNNNNNNTRSIISTFLKKEVKSCLLCTPNTHRARRCFKILFSSEWGREREEEQSQSRYDSWNSRYDSWNSLPPSSTFTHKLIFWQPIVLPLNFPHRIYLWYSEVIVEWKNSIKAVSYGCLVVWTKNGLSDFSRKFRNIYILWCVNDICKFASHHRGSYNDNSFRIYNIGSIY